MITEDKIQKLVEFIKSNRDLENANLETSEREEFGYFDLSSFGNLDDCFELGKKIGVSQTIENILVILEIE